jgi:hypothetical protein
MSKEINNIMVGASHAVRRPPIYKSENVNHTTVTDELALLSIGDFEPLHFSINLGKFENEISKFDNDWVDYLPRTDRVNNRKGLTITNLPGKGHMDNPSQAQAIKEAGRYVSEVEFSEPTDVYKNCPSLHPLLNHFSPLGRTFLVKSNMGGYFAPHRDHPGMPRESFRIAVFLKNCSTYEYDWIVGEDKKAAIELGRAYYINTRKTHRTISWVNDSIHLIINVPFTTENVSKLIGSLQHGH